MRFAGFLPDVTSFIAPQLWNRIINPVPLNQSYNPLYGKSKQAQTASQRRNITTLQHSHPREPDRQQHRAGRSPQSDA